MLQSRPYRAAKTFDEARREIARGMGSQFDPKVVAAFASVKDRLRDLVAMLRME